MELLDFRRDQFRLSHFLEALHRYSLANGGDGNPLPVVVGDLVLHDPIELAETLADDGEEVAEIPDDTHLRLEAGMTVFAQFTQFDGYAALECADGSRLKVREDEADECLAFGVAISLVGDTVEIEGRGLSDVTGESELEPMVAHRRIDNRMRRWIRSFATKKSK